MKILIVSDGTKKPGGWYTYTKTLIDALQSEGHAIIEWIPSSAPLSFMTNPIIAPWQAWKLRSVLKKEMPDIIHFPLEPHALMVPCISPTSAAKCVITVHGSYGVRLFQPATAKRAIKTFNHIGACITVSNYTKKKLLQATNGHCKSLDKKTHVIHNAIYPPKPFKKAQSNSTKHVITVGGIKPRKGTMEALEAFSLYIKNYDKNVHFIIIGTYQNNDAYYQQIQSFIYANSLTKYITITGPISDLELVKYFTQASALLMPAKTTEDTFEGFGLVYLEANGYGVPVIGPNDSGAKEAIADGTSGYTCDPSNAEAIAKALYAILEEGSISATDCRAWAEKHSPKIMAQAVETVYNSLT